MKCAVCLVTDMTCPACCPPAEVAALKRLVAAREAQLEAITVAMGDGYDKADWAAVHKIIDDGPDFDALNDWENIATTQMRDVVALKAEVERLREALREARGAAPNIDMDVLAIIDRALEGKP